MRDLGGVPKRPTGADCKSAGLRLRRFESFPHHRRPVVRCGGHAGVAQLVEHTLGKGEVTGSIPVVSSRWKRKYVVLLVILVFPVPLF